MSDIKLNSDNINSDGFFQTIENFDKMTIKEKGDLFSLFFF